MDDMTNVFLATLHINVRLRRQQFPHEREGQATMNALSWMHSDLHRELVGTEADCFYRDDVLPKFWEALAEKLGR